MPTPNDDQPLLALIPTPDNTTPTLTDQARIVLTDAEAFDQFYARMKAETDKHVPDVTTDKGRREVIALARRVTTTKTAITAAAKSLTEAWRQQTATVNAARKPIEDRLAALAAEVRQPVTDWETAEAARIERNRATVQSVRDAAIIAEGDTAASVEERGRRMHALTVDGDWTDGEARELIAAQEATVKALVAARDRLAQEEADRAELARLRAAEEERLRVAAVEQAAKDAREAEERAAREAQEAEDRRVADLAAAQQAEAERIAQAQREAAQRATEAAEQKAREEQAAKDRARDAEIAAANERAAAAERDAQAERDRAREEAQQRLNEEAARRRAEEAQAEEDARRARNRAHIAKVMGEAKTALMTTGISEEQARAIVVAIKADTIPHVRITF